LFRNVYFSHLTFKTKTLILIINVSKQNYHFFLKFLSFWHKHIRLSVGERAMPGYSPCPEGLGSSRRLRLLCYSCFIRPHKQINFTKKLCSLLCIIKWLQNLSEKLISSSAVNRGGEISKMYTCPQTSGLKKHLSVPMHYLSILLQIQMQIFKKWYNKQNYD